MGKHYQGKPKQSLSCNATVSPVLRGKLRTQPVVGHGVVVWLLQFATAQSCDNRSARSEGGTEKIGNGCAESLLRMCVVGGRFEDR